MSVSPENLNLILPPNHAGLIPLPRDYDQRLTGRPRLAPTDVYRVHANGEVVDALGMVAGIAGAMLVGTIHDTVVGRKGTGGRLFKHAQQIMSSVDGATHDTHTSQEWAARTWVIHRGVGATAEEERYMGMVHALTAITLMNAREGAYGVLDERDTENYAASSATIGRLFTPRPADTDEGMNYDFDQVMEEIVYESHADSEPRDGRSSFGQRVDHVKELLDLDLPVARGKEIRLRMVAPAIIAAFGDRYASLVARVLGVENFNYNNGLALLHQIGEATPRGTVGAWSSKAAQMADAAAHPGMPATQALTSETPRPTGDVQPRHARREND